jgi:hypothetical protein
MREPTRLNFWARRADRDREMSATQLRRVAPERVRRDGSPTVESLTQTHSDLVSERQALRSEGAAADALERNRLEIVHCQWELAKALLARHLPRPARSAA